MSENTARRVIGNVAVSLDGRTTGPGGEYDMGFILPHALSDGTRAGITRLTSATTAVMGRKAFEGFAGYWPVVARDERADPRDRAFAQWLDEVEKVVISTTLTDPSWPNSRVVNGDPVGTVRQLRGETGGDIVILTSQTILRQLLNADEIDRLSLNLLPEVLGGGARLFEDGLPASSWTLDAAQPDDTGAIWLSYDRVRWTEADGRFTLVRTLRASLSDAWRAWEDSELVRQWWGPTGFTCTRADVDLRVGGATKVTMQAPEEFGGFKIHNRWQFTVVDRPTRLSFVSTFVDDSGNQISPAAAGLPAGIPDEVPHDVTFAAAGPERTEMTLVEHGYTTAAARAQSEAGQAQCLDKMQALFTG
jgi:dihydrofolate reductase/uncharacterized protein YndB with AHSA1/START domain